MEYNWNTLEVGVYNSLDNNTDVVYKVKYGVSVYSNGSGVELIKEQELDVSSVTNFIDFENLTSQVVINWVKGSLGVDGVLAVEQEASEMLSKTLITSTKTLS